MSKPPARRRVRVVIQAKDVNDPQAILTNVLHTLQQKDVRVDLVVDQESVAPPEQATNEQLEADLAEKAGERLDTKPVPEPPKADAPAVDLKKVDEARGRIGRQLKWLSINGVKLAVKAALDWAMQKVKSSGGDTGP